jgi:hypothetical protein
MLLKNKKLITYGMGLFIFLSVIISWLIYKKNFSEKAKLEYCADINIIKDWLTGKITKSDLIEISGKEKQGVSLRPLKDKLIYSLYNKVWDECVNELRNSPIKFHEKNSPPFQFRNLFK